MTTTWSRYLPASVMIGGAVVTMLTGTPQPTPLAHPLTSTLPVIFLGKPGVDLPISADEQRVSGVAAYVNRGFDFGDRLGPVTLYVGYHATQQGDKRMHSPTLCLPGSGWTPIDSRLASIPLGSREAMVNRYVLQKDGEHILVYYWFQGRGRITATEMQLKLNALKDAFLYHRDEESLVRIVVPLAKGTLDGVVGTSGLPPDSVAVRLAMEAIPAVQRALPVAPY